MANLRIVFSIVIGFFCVASFTVCATASQCDSNSSFKKLVGDTERNIYLGSFTLSQKKKGKTFELRMGNAKYFGFSAFQGKDEKKNQLGPLSIEYKDSLTRLIEQGMMFSGHEKSGQFAMNMNWKMYPESIKKWTKIWQNSSLRKKWDKTDQYARYKSLTDMISEFLKEDMQNIATSIGFEITGASMEKMAHYKAGKLEFYDKVLKSTGIPEDMKIPIPMMMHLLLKPLPDSVVVKENTLDPIDKIQVDSLFVTAKLNSTNVYCSFRRFFDDYEITGDTLEEDRTYTRLLPISDPEYQAIATKLFQVCLKATNADKQEAVFFRMNLKLYPEVYSKVIERFNFSPMPAKGTKRPGLSNKKFYEYIPGKNSGFKAQVNPFLEQNGYVFSTFEISLDSGQKAKKYTDFESIFKPLGIKSGDKPFVPEFVYMKIVPKK